MQVLSLMPIISLMQTLRHIRKLSIRIKRITRQKPPPDCHMIRLQRQLIRILSMEAILPQNTRQDVVMTVKQILKAEMSSSSAWRHRVRKKLYVPLTARSFLVLTDVIDARVSPYTMRSSRRQDDHRQGSQHWRVARIRIRLVFQSNCRGTVHSGSVSLSASSVPLY
jgi:hypothetical protein